MAFGTTQGATQLLYDGSPMSVVSWSDTSIVATLPKPKASGDYAVSIVMGPFPPATHAHSILAPTWAGNYLFISSSGEVSMNLSLTGSGPTLTVAAFGIANPPDLDARILGPCPATLDASEATVSFTACPMDPASLAPGVDFSLGGSVSISGRARVVDSGTGQVDEVTIASSDLVVGGIDLGSMDIEGAPLTRQ